MFNVPPFHVVMPLIYFFFSNILIKAMPLFDESFFQMIDVAGLAMVDTLVQNPQNHLVHWTEIWLFGGHSNRLMKLGASEDFD